MASAIFGGSIDTEHRAVMALTHELAEGAYALCTASAFHVTRRSALLVTAAHCVVASDEQGDVATPPVPLPARELRVTAGTMVDGDRLLAREFPVVSVSVAPGYNGFLGNPDDVAIVRIVGIGADFPTLPVLSSNEPPAEVAEPVTLVGFGQTENAADTGVRRVTAQSVAWHDSQFIGFDQSNGRGLCEGDSGGPVLLRRSGGDRIAAVNSLAKGSKEQACIENGTSVQLARHLALLERAIDDVPASLDCDTCKLAEQAPGNGCSEPLQCDGECAALVSCVDACEGRSCVATCALAHSEGLEEYRAALGGARECAEQACAEACRATPPTTNPPSASASEGCSYAPLQRERQSSLVWWCAALAALSRRRRAGRSVPFCANGCASLP